jgi:hypothetical protein
MTKTIIATVFSLALVVPAYADVTIKQTVTGKGMGMGGTTQTTMHIKGNKMRTDMTIGDRVQSSIMDIDAQKMYSFDSKKKEVAVYDMATMAQELSKSVDTANMTVSFKPNGQTKQIAGKTATGYDMEISMPTTMPGSKDMAMTMTLTGPTWIVKGAPGSAEYMAFYKNAVEKGWIFSDPNAAKAQPGQAKAFAEMYKQLAEAGGIAYETEAQMKMSGSGPMAGLFAKMGNVTMTTTVTDVTTDPLADDLFAPPAGYKLVNKK